MPISLVELQAQARVMQLAENTSLKQDISFFEEIDALAFCSKTCITPLITSSTEFHLLGIP